MSDPENQNTIEFSVRADRTKLFDALRKMNGDTSALGTRIVQSLLGGEVSFADAVGMECYGVSMTEKKEGT